ncbi:MAG: alcohol dehydrogenase catalytic domain-containing protein [Actinobacteria bacterium]|nr:alcohol dehydrogenase catalytic domain-containing protein [Actinomycetota bacterium]
MTANDQRGSRVAVLIEPARFEVRSVGVPVPGDDEVVVRVDECGICGSDLKMYAGTHAFMRPPIVMGHEISGTVAAAGAAAGFEPGAPVTVFPPVGCGSCFHCRTGHEQLCASMEFFGGQRAGGLADFIVAPRSHVLPIASSVPAELRVLIEPLAVAVHGVTRGAPEQHERAVVIGAGAIGLFTALVLRRYGLEDIVVIEVDPRRLRRAQELGFVAVDVGAEDPVDAIARVIRPEGADCVFECAGSQQTIATALAITRKGGRAVVVGNAPATIELDGLALQRGDRSLIGVLMYDLGDFQTAMDYLADGLLEAIPMDELVTRYALERIADAFADAKSGALQSLKAVVEL